MFLYVCWHHPALLFLTLLAALPVSAEFQFTASLGTDLPDEPLMIFVSGFFLILWIYRPPVPSATILSHPLVILLVSWLIWILVTAVLSTHPALSWKYLAAKLWYAGAFVLAPLYLFRQKRQIITSFCLLTTVLFLVTVWILFRHYFLGFSFATINDAVAPFFRNHVNYSAMLVCAVPVLLACYHLGNPGTKPFFAAGIAVLLIALFFSFSRGAWAALAGGLISYELIRRRKAMYAFIITLLIIMFALFWLRKNDRYLQFAHQYKSTIFHPNFREHLVATYQMKDVSTAERFYRWIAGIRMVKDSWLTGFGPNTFYQHYKPYAVPAFKTWVSDNKEQSTVHQYYLLLAIEQGIPGLIIFLLLTGSMLLLAQRLYHRVIDPFFKTLAMTSGVVLVMLLILNFLSDLVETDKAGSLFFLCIAVLVAADLHIREERTKHGSDFTPHM